MQITFDPQNQDEIKVAMGVIKYLGQPEQPEIITPELPKQPKVPDLPKQPEIITPELPKQPKVANPVKSSKGLVDNCGVPWNKIYHTDSKKLTAAGNWKRRREVTVQDYKAYAASFTAAPVPAPTAAPVPAPTAAPVPAPTAAPVSMLKEIDELLADMNEEGGIENFAQWVTQMLNWAKPGSKELGDLENDLPAQEKLRNNLASR